MEITHNEFGRISMDTLSISSKNPPTLSEIQSAIKKGRKDSRYKHILKRVKYATVHHVIYGWTSSYVVQFHDNVEDAKSHTHIAEFKGNETIRIYKL